MPTDGWGVVLLGDVIGSRDRSAAATQWLERLRDRLDAAYAQQRLAPWEFTQGDEIQGLLHPDAEPFAAVLEAILQPHVPPGGVPRMRWVVVFGAVDPGHGPATQRTGEAFLVARAAIAETRRTKDGLRCRTEDARTDALLDGTAPVLAAIIDGMTDRQREVARLALVEGLRQSDIAKRFKIARPTVSVSYARGGVRDVERLVGAVRALWQEGVKRRLEAGALP